MQNRSIKNDLFNLNIKNTFIVACFLTAIAVRVSLAQPVTLSLTDHVVDLIRRNWSFVAYEPKQTPLYAEVSARKDWRPIQVGQRWEKPGHPEVIDKREHQKVWGNWHPDLN